MQHSKLVAIIVSFFLLSSVMLSIELTLDQNLVFAADKKTKKKKVRREHIRKANISQFEKIAKLSSAKKYAAMNMALDELAKQSSLNNIESAYVENYRGSACMSTGDKKCAAGHFVEALKYRAGMDDAFYFQLVRQVANIHFAISDYQSTKHYAQEYVDFAPTPQIDMKMLLAQAYYKLDDHELALTIAESAIMESFENVDVPKKSWFILLGALYDKADRNKDRDLALKQIKIYYPKNRHKTKSK